MATTVAITSPFAGTTVYTWDALAADDTTGSILVGNAHTILVQFAGTTFNSSQINVQVSLDGTTWLPAYEKGPSTTNTTIGNTTPTAVAATAAGVKIYDCQLAAYARIQVTGGTGTGLKCVMLLRTL